MGKEMKRGITDEAMDVPCVGSGGLTIREVLALRGAT
jgi:hypothetical protein